MSKNSPDEIVSALFSAFVMLKTRLGLKADIHQVPMAQMEALRFIHERKTTLMKEVADFLGITPPSATVLVNNLATAGFVERSSDKKDRRTIHLTLTKKGTDVLMKSIGERHRALKKLLNNLSSKEQVQLIEILRKMVRDN